MVENLVALSSLNTYNVYLNELYQFFSTPAQTQRFIRHEAMQSKKILRMNTVRVSAALSVSV